MKSKNLLFVIVVSTILLASCSKPAKVTYKPDTSDKGIVIVNDGASSNIKIETPSSKPVEETPKSDTSTSSKPNTETPAPSPAVSQNNDVSKFSTKETDWFYIPKTDGTTSGEPQDVKDLISKYSAYYVSDTSKKIIYLTFDEGYENGYSSKILDILKQNNIKASFFVTTPYITGNKDLVKRMVAEGHDVCNHSTTHPSMASITDNVKFNKEILTAQETFEGLTGTKMPRFFRPPMGKYSELSLYYTQKLGYKTIFWSFAYADWDPDKQPTEEYAKKIIAERTHNGAIFLLHAVSKTDTEVLDSVIKDWKNKGFEIKPLTSMP